MACQANVAEVLAALNTRHEDSDETLTAYVQSNFSGSQQSLRQLRPFLEEIARRFKHLPRKRQINNEYKTISGYRTFKDFCQGVLNRTAHRVRQILKEAHGQTKKSIKGTEDIYAVSEQIEKYLTRKVEKFKGSDRTELLENVGKILENLTGSTKAGL